MKLKIIFAYLDLPFLLMLFTLIMSAWEDAPITEIIYVIAIGGILYLLPFLLWIVIARYAGFSRIY